MTDKVDPAPSSDGQAYMVAQTIKQHGAIGDGWIAETGTAYAADHANSGVTGAPLNAFGKAAETGLDVTIDTGEAFIGGSWVARDTQTTVSLADNTTGQTISVGWDYNAADTVKIGEVGTTVGDTFDAKDPRIPLFTFDTASGAVSGETDERTIGKTTDLGDASLAAGSNLNRYLMSAVSDTAVGTEGNSANELWRAPGSSSDLVASLAGSGTNRANWAWNAYWDAGVSKWKYITGSEEAHRITFDPSGVNLHTAPGGTADAEITGWKTLRLTSAGDLSDATNTIYDRSAAEVPKARLGGPASSLTSYPLPAGDISDGSGSGLDADTVDGQEPSEFAGDWTEIATYTDTTTTTDLTYDTGTMTTTYEEYKLEIFRTNQAGHTENDQHIRINGIGSSSYHYDWYDAFNNTFQSTDNDTEFDKIAVTNGDGDAGDFVRQTLILSCPTPATDTTETWPVISTPVVGGGKNTDYCHSGHVAVDSTEISRINLYGGDNSTGKVRLLGRNLH